MLKLARIFKASRVLKRLAQDILMSKLEMSFAQPLIVRAWSDMHFVTGAHAPTAPTKAPRARFARTLPARTLPARGAFGRVNPSHKVQVD